MYNKKMLSDLFNIVTNYLRWIKIRNKKPEINEIKKSMGAENFRKELCTLHIGLPRRAGNTTLGIRILKKNPKALFFAGTEGNANEVKNLLNKRDLMKRVFSKNSNDYIGMDASIVIVDTASYLTEREKDKFYSIYCDAIIFLG